MRKTFHIDPPSIREACLEACQAFKKWNLDPEDSHEMALALDEALTNIFEHGYEKHRPDRPVTIEIINGSHDIYIVIADQARPFVLEIADLPDKENYINSNIVGGFGISLIKSVMDHVRHFRLFEENVLIMQKRLAPAKPNASGF